MDVNNLMAVLLAGNPKCYKTVPNYGVSYLAVALKAARGLDCPIICVAPLDAVATDKGVIQVQSSRKLFDNIAAGLTACGTDPDHIVLVATDLPLLTPQALRDFVEKALALNPDVCVALADLEKCRILGHTTKHPVPLGGQMFKFGSVFLLRRSASLRILGLAKELLELRKQPIRLVFRFLSWRFLFDVVRFALSFFRPSWSFSFVEAERLIYQKVNLRFRAVVGDPGLAIDID